MNREIHLYLDLASEISARHANKDVRTTYRSTMQEILHGSKSVHTTITHFLRWKYGDRLFCHLWDKKELCMRTYEITPGDCVGTERHISLCHNIEKMLLSGEFSWFKPEDIP